jgi:predicted transglutaminase-like cysteine proteinase
LNNIALPPYGWTAFEVAPPLSRADTLDRVNRLVNEAIAPRYGEVSPTDPWLIAPRLGWCHDYAVTKRWLLLGLGFKPAELLLCECIGPDGAHHLVLRVENVVLDNLTDVIGPVRYPVVRQQSAGNPDIWESDAPMA